LFVLITLQEIVSFLNYKTQQ